MGTISTGLGNLFGREILRATPTRYRRHAFGEKKMSDRGTRRRSAVDGRRPCFTGRRLYGAMPGGIRSKIIMPVKLDAQFRSRRKRFFKDGVRNNPTGESARRTAASGSDDPPKPAGAARLWIRPFGSRVESCLRTLVWSTKRRALRGGTRNHWFRWGRDTLSAPKKERRKKVHAEKVIYTNESLGHIKF